MKVWKISVDGEMLGVIVDKHGALSSDGALAFWNDNAGPSYQGDSASEIRAFEND